MDSQDIRNLQEAYLDVYEEKKERNPEKILRQFEKHRVTAERKSKEGDNTGAVRSGARYSGMRDFITTDSRSNPETTKKYQDAAKKVFKPKNQKEQVDLYDIILSHLLDEGYADTQEAAETIMVNMSEEWRDSIMEAGVDYEMTSDEMEKARNERKFGKQGFNQAGQTELRRGLHKSKRGMKKGYVRRFEGEK